MAAKTSNGTGDWGTGGTWVGGVVPADGDSVTIATGHTVTFNVDQSAWTTGLIGLTITGTLQCTTTAGTYYLKMSGTSGQNISGNGSLLAGSSGTPLPANVKFTIDLGAASQILRNGSNALTVALYCTNPTNKYCRMSGANNANATAINIDRDLTGDTQWTSGANIGIVNVNKALDVQAVHSNPRTVVSTSTGPNVLNISTGGLDSNHVDGAYIYLLDRNITILCNSSNNSQVFLTGAGGTAGTFDCAIRNTNSSRGGQLTNGGTDTLKAVVSGFYFAWPYPVSASVTGAMMVANQYSILYGAAVTIDSTTHVAGCSNSGVAYMSNSDMSCSIIGCSGGLRFTMSGVFRGTLYGNANGAHMCGGLKFDEATVTNNANGTLDCSLMIFTSTFSSNTADVAIEAWGGGTTELWRSSATTFTGYTTTQTATTWERVISWDHNNVTGDIAGAMRGGTISTVSDQVPSGFSKAYKFTGNSTEGPVFLALPVTLTAGRQIAVTAYFYKSSSTYTTLPCIQIYDETTDTAVATATMPDTNTTWETVVLKYTPTVTGRYYVRILTKTAAGQVWFQYRIQPEAVPVNYAVGGL